MKKEKEQLTSVKVYSQLYKQARILFIQNDWDFKTMVNVALYLIARKDQSFIQYMQNTDKEILFQYMHSSGSQN